MRIGPIPGVVYLAGTLHGALTKPSPVAARGLNAFLYIIIQSFLGPKIV